MDTLHPTTRPDHRDLSLEHFAADEAAVVDLAAALQVDNQVLHLQVSTLLEQLHNSLEREARLRATVERQTETIRAYIEPRPSSRRAA